MNYSNAHATSTLAGDLAEVRAIKQVFNNTSEIKINSTKVYSLPSGICIFFNWKDPFCCILFPNGVFLLPCQSMIGHCLGAAGGLEAIATVEAITTGWVHPTINQFVSDHYKFFISYLYCVIIQQTAKFRQQNASKYKLLFISDSLVFNEIFKVIQV